MLRGTPAHRHGLPKRIRRGTGLFSENAAEPEVRPNKKPRGDRATCCRARDCLPTLPSPRARRQHTLCRGSTGRLKGRRETHRSDLAQKETKMRVGSAAVVETRLAFPFDNNQVPPCQTLAPHPEAARHAGPTWVRRATAASAAGKGVQDGGGAPSCMRHEGALRRSKRSRRRCRSPASMAPVPPARALIPRAGHLEHGPGLPADGPSPRQMFASE